YRANEQSIARKAESGAKGFALGRRRREAIGIDAVGKDAETLRRSPSLAGMIGAKIRCDSEDGVGEGISGTAQQAAAQWQSMQDVQLIAVFAVNRYGDAGPTRCEDSFDPAPVARVDDVRAEAAHNASKAVNEKATVRRESIGIENATFEAVLRSERGVVPAGGADGVRKLAIAKTRDDFQDAGFRATEVEPVDDMQHTQSFRLYWRPHGNILNFGECAGRCGGGVHGAQALALARATYGSQ